VDGRHHHGELESVIYVVRGRAPMRWGERLQFVAEAGPSGFIFVPRYVPYKEINVGAAACSCAQTTRPGSSTSRMSSRRETGGGLLGRFHAREAVVGVHENLLGDLKIQ
jgi:hypothetical protein